MLSLFPAPQRDWLTQGWLTKINPWTTENSWQQNEISQQCTWCNCWCPGALASTILTTCLLSDSRFIQWIVNLNTFSKIKSSKNKNAFSRVEPLMDVKKIPPVGRVNGCKGWTWPESGGPWCSVTFVYFCISHSLLTESDIWSLIFQRVQQVGKLKLFGTRPNWAVYYMYITTWYTKFHLPKPVFHSPDQIFTRIGERASASFPDCSACMFRDYSCSINSLAPGRCGCKLDLIIFKIISIKYIYLKYFMWNCPLLNITKP